MLSTMPLAAASAADVQEPGKLFNAEDLALAELSAPEIWDRIVTIAVREHASDIHLTCQCDGVHVGLRLDGRIYPQGIIPAELGARLANHTKVLANMDVAEKRRPQDGHVVMQIDGREVDLRISLLPTNHGEDVALRVLDCKPCYAFASGPKRGHLQIACLVTGTLTIGKCAKHNLCISRVHNYFS